MDVRSFSIQSAAWKRLKRNKAALFGIFVIVLAIFTAVFGYVIAPDSSPYANRMIVEIGGKKPGFKQLFLKIKKENPVSHPNFFSRLISGKEDEYNYIPINRYWVTGDSLVTEKVIDEGIYDTLFFPASSFAKPLGKNFIWKTSLLGTDKYGRDLLSRLIIGVRVSLSVGLISLVISLTLGILLGAIAGYFRGKIDEAI